MLPSAVAAHGYARPIVSLELDHIFVWTKAGAPEADRLVALGLTEGPPNRHDGQGTSCRRFFFRNAYLELLWVHDPSEAQAEAVRRIGLDSRWLARAEGGSPFGLVFRPVEGGIAEPPFGTFDYHPSYLPKPLVIRVGTNAAIFTEPLLFYLPFARRPDRYPDDRRPPLAHGAGLREMTRVELTVPSSVTLSPELRSVVDRRLVGLRAGTGHGVEWGFDGERRGGRADLRPDLPVVVQW